MKKSSIVLFGLRLFLYFSVIVLIFIHPGISVTFDRIGIIQWFFVIPLMAITAFIPEKVIKAKHKPIVIGVIVFVLAFFAGQIGVEIFLQLFIAGLVSYALTSVLFYYPQWGKIAAIEPFFLAWVCLRLLLLSRSGEDIAGQSVTLTQFILVWTAVVFLLHNIIIYLCLYPESRAKVWKEGLVFFFGAFAILIILLVVLPPDFVRNRIIENLVTDRIPERIRPSDSERGLPQRGNGRRTLPRGEGRDGELRGIPEHEWQGRGGSSAENRQYMIKVVASDREPIYMGEHFRGQLDPIDGFTLSSQEPLNELSQQRFFVTWRGNENEFDLGRSRQEVFSLSTLRRKYFPYRPFVIDPTILSENSGPLRYIHQVVSNTHLGDPLMLVNTPTRFFSDWEKDELAHYLEIPLEDSDRDFFISFLNNTLEMWRINKGSIIKSDRYLEEIFLDYEEERSNEYIETIIALLTGFSLYQYNLNPEDDYAIDSLKHFLANSKEGDCVEFSNSLALLGRLAGIPSRVVTGYIAAEQLQTPAHLRGLSVLRNSIPALREFPFDNLFMVTNLHSHSWTQFFIPDYGWLDFEATAFSLPPDSMGDFNNWDVVIPIIDQQKTFSNVRKFPWQAVGRAVITLAIFALVCAYVLRYGHELILYIGTQGNNSSRTRSRSLYLLLLARLAADGQPIKPASKTAHEYSELFAESLSRRRRGAEVNKEIDFYFRTFADIYSEIRWRQFADIDEEKEKFKLLIQEYNEILDSTLKHGLHHRIKRILSLRGLAYL